MNDILDKYKQIQLDDESEELFDVFSFSHSDSNEYNLRSSTELKNKDRVLLQKVLYYSAKSKGLEHTAIEKLLDLTIKELDYQYTRKEHLDNKSGFLLTLWGIFTVSLVDRQILKDMMGYIASGKLLQIVFGIMFFLSLLVSLLCVVSSLMIGKMYRFEFNEVEANFLSVSLDKEISYVALLEAYTNICVRNLKTEKDRKKLLDISIISIAIYVVITILI